MNIKLKLPNIIFTLFISTLFILILGHSIYSQSNTEFVCFPCGSECDNEIHHNPGTCSGCGMDLIERSRVKMENLSPEQVAEILSEVNDVILLDVRTVEEFESNGTDERHSLGHLKNAINIPNTELIERISEIENYKDREIIVYCSRSHRSPYSAQQLTDLGFSKIKNMSEGLSVFVSKGLVNTKTGDH